ncbi:MAG: serine/threonine protein kinase [Planctomycetes bacterium]|nr:serine/threonine protein kinase [Planctomycetota bacterium]
MNALDEMLDWKALDGKPAVSLALEQLLEAQPHPTPPPAWTQAPARGVPPTLLERPTRGTLCTSTNTYVVREKIGEGGMGVVYRAFDAKLHRDVALKVLLHPDEDALERFLREQEITACLDHPNFVRVLARGYLTLGARSVPFYTMPLIRGTTLDQLILRRQYDTPEGMRLQRQFTPAVLLGMLGQLCLALQSAHDKRIIHRDLKPANILVGPYGEAYVTDLGLAKVLTPAPGEAVRFETRVMEQLAGADAPDGTHETMMGTPYYMAPEQADTPRSVDHRADIFGLGAILYFILTCRKPEYRQTLIDREKLLARKQQVVAQLKPFAGPFATAASLLARPIDEIPENLRLRVEEYREILGLLSNMGYHKLRRTLKECSIVPPNVHLGLRGGARVDPALDRICMKALARNPDDRYPSGRAFAEALQTYRETGGGR